MTIRTLRPVEPLSWRVTLTLFGLAVLALMLFFIALFGVFALGDALMHIWPDVTVNGSLVDKVYWMAKVCRFDMS
jgi:hypothetical protein